MNKEQMEKIIATLTDEQMNAIKKAAKKVMEDVEQLFDDNYSYFFLDNVPEWMCDKINESMDSDDIYQDSDEYKLYEEFIGNAILAGVSMVYHRMLDDVMGEVNDGEEE